MLVGNRILVAQEDRESLGIISQVLMREGCYMLASRDGKNVEKMLEFEPPDLVLLDLNLPGLSGEVLLELIRASKTWRLVPVIVLSSRSAELEVKRAFELGADDFIAKPYGVAEMVARLNKRLADGKARRLLQTRLASTPVPTAG
jgi:DNA-binding response OmpR family regulator